MQDNKDDKKNIKISRIGLGLGPLMECRSKALHEEGDHAILIGEVEHCHWTAQHPLVYHAGRFDLTPDVETADTP